MRFISRFDLTADPETVELCRSIKDTFKELPKPRLWGEWVRWVSAIGPPLQRLEVPARDGMAKTFS